MEFYILYPYSPIIQTIAALASELSSCFKCAHKSLIMLSYLSGYYLNMSLITITVSSITNYAATFVLMSSWKHKTHLSDASSNLIAIRPIAEMAFLARVMSTSRA